MQFEPGVQPFDSTVVTENFPLDTLQEATLSSRPVDYLGDSQWQNQPTCYKARSICWS
jgi:hypothetical protein